MPVSQHNAGAFWFWPTQHHAGRIVAMDAVRFGALITRGAPVQVLGLALAPLCIWPPGRRARKTTATWQQLK